MARKQCQVCGQPATVRVETNLNGRHSTMLLCDDHYRQLVRQQKRTVSPLEALFSSRSGLFEDFLGSDFFRIDDDTTPVAADTDDVVDASLSEPAAAGSGCAAPSRQWAGQPHQRTVGSLAAGGRQTRCRIWPLRGGYRNICCWHWPTATWSRPSWVSSRSRSMTSSGRSSLRPSAGTSPSRARSACRHA